MINFAKFNNIISLTSYFNTKEKCQQAIIESRWSDGDVVCPYCGAHHCSKRGDGRFRCNHCLKNFSCLVGTIFTQASAWYMLQKIRLLYPQSDAEAFEGTVECDEVYIGGKEKWKHKSMRTPHTQGRSTLTKTPVFGMMERTYIEDEKGDVIPMSYVHAFVVEKTDKATLQPIIKQFVAEGSTVITDELNAYNGLSKLGYGHAVVNHGAEEYANGDIFTNSIEGFWSHFRRMITGCYHDVSDEHLQQYIDEAVYRWNTRKASESERFSDMFARSIGLIVRWSDVKLCQTA